MAEIRRTMVQQILKKKVNIFWNTRRHISDDGILGRNGIKSSVST